MQSAYTLAFGGLLLLGARAGDILGRRRMLIAGMAVFTAARGLGMPGARALLAHRVATALTAGTAMLGLALVVVVGLIVRPGGAAEAAGIWKRRAA